MNKAFVIFVLLTVLLSSTASAQTQAKFDTTFVNTSSVAFFKANPSINTVKQVNSGIYPKFIDIYTRPKKQKGKANNSTPEEFKRYNLQVAPDIYALMKEYGILILPEKEISMLLKNGWADYSLDVAMSADSIHLSVSFYYPEEASNPDEKIFIKVEKPRGYVGGIKKLEKEIGEQISVKKIRLSKNIEDSVLAFKMIITKDGNIAEPTLLYGNPSDFSQTIKKMLLISKPWVPADGGGRPAKSYTGIFIRLHRDKSLTIYFPG